MLLQKVRDRGQTRDRGRKERRIADLNPARIDPARDIITTALEDLPLAQVGIVQTHKLENFPQTMRLFRQIAEESASQASNGFTIRRAISATS